MLRDLAHLGITPVWAKQEMLAGSRMYFVDNYLKVYVRWCNCLEGVYNSYSRLGTANGADMSCCVDYTALPMCRSGTVCCCRSVIREVLIRTYRACVVRAVAVGWEREESPEERDSASWRSFESAIVGLGMSMYLGHPFFVELVKSDDPFLAKTSDKFATKLIEAARRIGHVGAKSLVPKSPEITSPYGVGQEGEVSD